MRFDALLTTAVLTFVATNLDDLALLVGWFSDGRYSARHIAAGQFVGIAVLTGVSVLFGFAAINISKPLLGLLGLVPIWIGLARLLKKGDERIKGPLSAAQGVLSVAGVTIAHGGDNLVVYIPFFVTQPPLGLVAIGITFMTMTAVWLALAHWFVTHPAWGPIVQRAGRRLVPWVLILLGASILYEAGTGEWFARLI
jgi:cadmium resistance protein CadD (predicted permease)